MEARSHHNGQGRREGPQQVASSMAQFNYCLELSNGGPIAPPTRHIWMPLTVQQALYRRTGTRNRHSGTCSKGPATALRTWAHSATRALKQEQRKRTPSCLRALRSGGTLEQSGVRKAHPWWTQSLRGSGACLSRSAPCGSRPSPQGDSRSALIGRRSTKVRSGKTKASYNGLRFKYMDKRKR